MILDSGKLTVCTLKNTAKKGDMPKNRLEKGNWHFYKERTIGYNRQYAAMGVNQRIDMLARIWQDRTIRADMYALIEDEQYRITVVQHLLNEDNLPVTDLTLERLDDLYDVASET